jgi:tRNA 5-methylaminomethyl-2-thiouridine biosynthesis bifunctional protein
MPAPLVPARLAFATDGTPYSEAYGDIYHSAAGGLGQARHVFLAGNGLPERWRGCGRFAVLETGFGLGLNFLATWQAWRDDPRRCARLHFVSIEAHPFAAPDLVALHAPYPDLAPLSAELRAAWPLLVPGFHRLEFERGNVVLTLAFADAGDALRSLRVAADAIYLDGFAPANNPAMWSRETMRAIARLAAPGATAATWSASAAVRGALGEAGFAVDKRAGYAGKREMTCARLALLRRVAASAAQERRALVIGAGLAGGAVCERLAARDWDVTLLERRAAPALETSGNHAGVFHPLISPDDNLFSRLTRAAFTWWLGHCQRLETAGVAPQWARCGVLQLARDEDESIAQRAAIAQHAYPPEYARCLDQAQASSVAGVPVAAGGTWFAQAGWVRPPSLVHALLAKCGARLEARFNCEVSALERSDGQWIARDLRGREILSASVVVLANAADALTLAPQRHLALRRVRGQATHISGNRFALLRTVLLRGGYLIPPVEGIAVAGASFDLDDDDPAPRAAIHADNLERLERILPGSSAGLDPEKLEGRVGFRAVARDRLPVIGALADDAVIEKPGPLAAMPRIAGLYAATAYGSRGILWAGLGAELLASVLEGEPLPVEGALADAVDPARFAQRALRRGRSPP